MAVLTYILILGLQRLVLGLECGRDVHQELTMNNKLRDDLLKCGYESIDPPKGPHSEQTTVTVKFIMKYFTLITTEDVLNLQTWTFISWRDDRLKWDTAKYGDLEEINVNSGDIWTPTFRIINSADVYDDIDTYDFLPCTVKHKGDVFCVPRSTHTLFCDIKLSDFPYDAQTCSFIYGVLDPNKSYNVTFGSRAMSMLGADYGSSWFISDYKQQVQNVPDIRLNITLVIEREAESLAAVIVYPALIISSLSIACMFLDVRLKERIIFTCFSFFCNCYWLRELVANLPKLSEDPPRILLYYRGSLVITVFIILLTFILSAMCRKKSAPHNIIILINKFVYESYVRVLVYPRWELPNDSKFNEDWTKFANSVNSLCIKVIVFSYIAMYIAFIPQPIPFN